MDRRALVMALAMSVFFSGATNAQSGPCSDPPTTCRKTVSTDCFDRFGAGSVSAETLSGECKAQLEIYTSCLSLAAERCDGGAGDIEAKFELQNFEFTASACTRTSSDIRCNVWIKNTSETSARLEVEYSDKEGILYSPIGVAVRTKQLVVGTITRDTARRGGDIEWNFPSLIPVRITLVFPSEEFGESNFSPLLQVHTDVGVADLRNIPIE